MLTRRARSSPRHGAAVVEPKIGERVYDRRGRLGGLPVRVVRLHEGHPRPHHQGLNTLQTRTFVGKEKKRRWLMSSPS